MAKTLNGGALIAYGPTLPSAGATPDGALFYKTDSLSGGPQGLYVYGFLKDSNASLLGAQVMQGWVQATSPDLFVLKGGDTMLGPLTVPAILRVTENNTTPQRILIGYQGSGAMPTVLEGSSGGLSIGIGSNWGTGGTVTAGLGINPTLGNSGLTWQNVQVWHANNDGSGSTLDADLLDGQHGAFYQNANNINAGILAVARGGTGNAGALVPGGILYGSSGTVMGSSAAGTSGQVLLSGGTGSPTWVNQSTLSVGSATTASSANTATYATSAGSATTATNVAWGGITGLDTSQGPNNTLISGGSVYFRPSMFVAMSSVGGASPTPNAFLANSLTGFDSYYTSDMGQYQVGLTVVGSGSRGAQLAMNWNFEELAPSGGLRYRVNDDTSNTNAWGAWRTVWDQGNLTALSQLTNDMNFMQATGTPPTFNTAVQPGSPTYYWGSNNGTTYYPFSTGSTVVSSANYSNNTLTAQNNTNATFFPAFVASNGGGQQTLYTTGNISFNPGTGTINATFFNGRAASANYADLAERYTADYVHPVGTVMVVSLSEEHETMASFRRGQKVLGVVSENPAYLMNAECDGPALALRGRVPVFVTGPVRKGDLLIAEDDGSAVVQTNDQGKEFAQALVTDLRTERRLVECAVF